MNTGLTGVLPKQSLREIVRAGFITGVDEKYINPASIDLPLSDEAYCLERIFIPKHGEVVRDILPIMGATRHDMSAKLERHLPYLIRIEGNWKLPENVYGYANPKSSTGRLNFFCRIIADRVAMYDALTGPGWKGEMWVLMRPDSFPVFVSPGLALAQVRLFNGKAFLNQHEIDSAITETGLIFDEHGTKSESSDLHKHADSLLLSLSVDEEMGWECRGESAPLDMSKIGFYEVTDFFQPVTPTGDGFKLRKGSFYILSTRERVMVPPHLSAELRPIDPRLGEFRSHAAGYIDPGWGYGNDGSVCGRPITLEVIPHEDMFVRHGQAIARIRYERMLAVPEISYDQAQSNYVRQRRAMLSKHFKAC